MKFIGYCLRQSLFFNLLTVFILICGVITLMNTRREAFPLVVMDIALVLTEYPGSSPKEIEKLISIPVERALKAVDGIDKLHSVSIEGRSTVITTIEEDLSRADKDKVITDIQRAIDRMDDLPEDVDKPIVKEIKTHQRATIEVNLSGLPELELRKYSDILQDHLELLTGVSAVYKRGYREREFWVEANPLLLKELHLSLDEIVSNLASQNINLPGGTLKRSSQEYLVRTIGELENPEQVSHVVIRTNDSGKTTQIQDVATVVDTFEEEVRVEKIRGDRTITLIVLKREKGDSIEIVSAVDNAIKAFKKITPESLKIETSNDTSYYVKRRLKVLINNGWFGMMLVLCSILFFLSKRIAFITAFGIPFSFFMTFIVMYFLDLSINLISMFGLIIVSGMLVDDAIVFSENIFRHMQKGKSPHEAALVGSAEVLRPVTATIITTIISFLPLAFMSGTMGKFVWQIPAVVIIALIASLFEAVFILPSHCAELVDAKKVRMENPKWFEKFRTSYMDKLKIALHYKYRLLGGVTVAFTIAALTGFFLIDFVLFPDKGIELFHIKAHTKIGTPLEETGDRMKQIENIVAALPKEEVDTYTTRLGITQADVHDPFTRRGSHVAQVTVYLTPEADRDRNANEIIRDLQAKIKPIEGFEFIRFKKMKPGPPIGKPISIDIRGDDLNTLQEIAALYKTALGKIKGVKEIADSHEEGKQELQIVVNELRASEANLSVHKIAKTLRNAFEGVIATTIKKTDEEINIRVRLAEKFRNDPQVFQYLLISNPRGSLIPLTEVADIKTGKGISYINRYNQKRNITVNASIDSNITNSFDVNKRIEKEFENIEEQYVGYNVLHGGEQEDSQKSLSSLGRAFIVAAVGILFILCVIFGSLAQPLIVMITLPLSAIGVVIAFFTHGQPFSFMAILGVIGLCGVVVNNAIILISLINTHRVEETTLFDAVVKACHQRLRPILLTSITTVVGLGPVAYGLGGSDEILKPAALALSWGLLFASTLTLFVIPCLYLVLYEWVDKAKVRFPWIGRLPI